MNNLQKRKRAFMSLITRPLGFVRSVSGTLPLSLPYAMEGTANYYAIEGKSVQGKNLIPYPYILPSWSGASFTKPITSNGVTFTPYNDGSILINGTATAATSQYLYNNKTSLIPGIKVGDTICISKNVDDESQHTNVYLSCNYYNSDGIQQSGFVASNNIAYNKTIPDTWVGMCIYIHVPKGKTLNNLIIKPQLEQGSTATEWESPVPSPENPIEIKSVGVKTRNLFDYTKKGTVSSGGVTWASNLDGTYTTSGMLTSVTSNYNLSSAITEDLEIGVPYTFGSETGYYDDRNVRYFMMIAIKNTETGSTRYVAEYGGNTFTLAENEYVSMFDIRLNSVSGTLYEIDNVVYKPFLYKGEREPKFEPYGKYKLNVVNNGVNLWSRGDLENISVTTKTTISLSPGIYTLSSKIDSNGSTDENGEMIEGTSYVLGRQIDNIAIALGQIKHNTGDIESLTFTLTSDINELRIYAAKTVALSTGKTYTATNVQIQEGALATDYEPYRPPVSTPIYLDEPLRGIGDYKDKIDFESGNLVRKIISKTFNGSEDWRASSDCVYMAWSGTAASRDCLCTHYPNDIHKNSGGIFIRPVTDVLRVYYITDVDVWKDILATQYKSENPVAIHTQLLTPKTESITLPDLQLFEGTNILSIDGDIQPDMTVIYKASVKEV